MPRQKAPELTWQQHIADYLVCEHKYDVLEQTDITDSEHCIVEEHLLGVPSGHPGRHAPKTHGRLWD